MSDELTKQDLSAQLVRLTVRRHADEYAVVLTDAEQDVLLLLRAGKIIACLPMSRDSIATLIADLEVCHGSSEAYTAMRGPGEDLIT